VGGNTSSGTVLRAVCQSWSCAPSRPCRSDCGRAGGTRGTAGRPGTARALRLARRAGAAAGRARFGTGRPRPCADRAGPGARRAGLGFADPVRFPGIGGPDAELRGPVDAGPGSGDDRSGRDAWRFLREAHACTRKETSHPGCRGRPARTERFQRAAALQDPPDRADLARWRVGVRGPRARVDGGRPRPARARAAERRAPPPHLAAGPRAGAVTALKSAHPPCQASSSRITPAMPAMATIRRFAMITTVSQRGTGAARGPDPPSAPASFSSQATLDASARVMK
jgi:hypothetical protein